MVLQVCEPRLGCKDRKGYRNGLVEHSGSEEWKASGLCRMQWYIPSAILYMDLRKEAWIGSRAKTSRILHT